MAKRAVTDFSYLAQRLASLDERDRRRRMIPRACDGAYLVDSQGQRLLNFGGNDYLGLVATSNGDLRHVPNETSTSHFRCGSAASPLVCGWTPAHAELAQVIAQFESTEAAVVFASGYAACSGCVATLAEADDLILSDELNHASLIDGCRLSRADRVIYSHRDTVMLASLLEDKRDHYRRAWIVTDGVFSMDGHVAPLPKLCELAERFDADLIVDEAHGTGVLGETGRGVCEALGVKEKVAIRIGTLSKAIGGQGGFVAGPGVVIDYLVNACRSLIFSTSLAPPAVAAALDGFDIIQRQPERREKVQRLARRFRQRLSIEANSLEAAVPIIPVVVGEDSRALAASQQLSRSGFYVPAIRPPTVPDGTARLRVSLSAAHDESMIDSLVAAIDSLP